MSSQLLICIYRQILTKSLGPRILLIHKGINFCTKSKTHYDILKISPNATHNEIKSAYYKLSIEYHPDKNKSLHAKQMFQEVSNAYEVLGNFKLRQQYDRSVAITRRHNIQTPHSQPQWQTPCQTTSPPETIYNFDEWTRQHYQRSFQVSLKRKILYQKFLENQRYFLEKKRETEIMYYIHVVLITIFYLVFFINHLLSPKNTSSNKKDSDSEY